MTKRRAFSKSFLVLPEKRMLPEAIYGMLGKMTERYLYVQRNANIDRSETKTNEFLAFKFLPKIHFAGIVVNMTLRLYYCIALR